MGLAIVQFERAAALAEGHLPAHEQAQLHALLASLHLHHTHDPERAAKHTRRSQLCAPAPVTFSYADESLDEKLRADGLVVESLPSSSIDQPSSRNILRAAESEA